MRRLLFCCRRCQPNVCRHGKADDGKPKTWESGCMLSKLHKGDSKGSSLTCSYVLFPLLIWLPGVKAFNTQLIVAAQADSFVLLCLHSVQTSTDGFSFLTNLTIYRTSRSSKTCGRGRREGRREGGREREREWKFRKIVQINTEKQLQGTNLMIELVLQSKE